MELNNGIKHWKVKKLDEVAFITMGQSPLSKYYNNEQIGLPLIQGNADIDNRKTIKRCYTSQITKKGQAGDIIMSVRAPVGEIARATFECCLGRGVCSISYKGDYLYHYLVYSENLWSKFSAGSTFESVNAKQVKDFEIFLPNSYAEQTAIATALTDMDNLIAGLEKLIEKKKAIKQGAMQELLRPKEGWVEWKFGEIFSFYSTANYSKAEMTDAGEIGCMHYGLIHSISTANYSLSGGVRYYLNETKTNYEYIRDGDVIMVDASEDLEGINKSVEVFGIGDQKFISGLHTYLLRDQNLVLVNGFRGPLLDSKLIKDQFLSLAVGMKVYGVSKVQLKEVFVPVPPKDEQVRIANTLFDMDTEIEAIEGLLDKNRRLKQGMMQELLTGKTRLV